MTKKADWRELNNRYAARFGNLLVTVTDKHIRYYGKWVIDCPPYFYEKELTAKTKERAMAEAVKLVRKQVQITMEHLADLEQAQAESCLPDRTMV